MSHATPALTCVLRRPEDRPLDRDRDLAHLRIGWRGAGATLPGTRAEVLRGTGSADTVTPATLHERRRPSLGTAPAPDPAALEANDRVYRSRSMASTMEASPARTTARASADAHRTQRAASRRRRRRNEPSRSRVRLRPVPPSAPVQIS